MDAVHEEDNDKKYNMQICSRYKTYIFYLMLAYMFCISSNNKIANPRNPETSLMHVARLVRIECRLRGLKPQLLPGSERCQNLSIRCCTLASVAARTTTVQEQR